MFQVVVTSSRLLIFINYYYYLNLGLIVSNLSVQNIMCSYFTITTRSRVVGRRFKMYL